jgi:hypothetical protein
MLLCSLTQPYFTAEGQPLGAIHDTPAGPKTSRLCIYAAIEFIYGGMCFSFMFFFVKPSHPAVASESSILVAMRSRRYPTSNSLKPAAYNDLDLGISLDIPQSQDPPPEEHVPPLEWGALAEEQTIELCEVKLRFDGMYMSTISITVVCELLKHGFRNARSDQSSTPTSSSSLYPHERPYVRLFSTSEG